MDTSRDSVGRKERERKGRKKKKWGMEEKGEIKIFSVFSEDRLSEKEKEREADKERNRETDREKDIEKKRTENRERGLFSLDM